MITFKQRQGKFNAAKLHEINSTPILNLYSKFSEDLVEVLRKFSAFENGMHGSEPGIVYGKYNSILKEFESSPGVWVFDFSNSVTLLMFSDGFRKNNYKGTSYEIVLTDNPNRENIIQALEVFYKDFQIKFKTDFPEQHESLKKLTQKIKF